MACDFIIGHFKSTPFKGKKKGLIYNAQIWSRSVRTLKSTPTLILVKPAFDVEKCLSSHQGLSRQTLSWGSIAGFWKCKLLLLAVLNERIWMMTGTVQLRASSWSFANQISHLKERRTCVFCAYIYSMNYTYAHLRDQI